MKAKTHQGFTRRQALNGLVLGGLAVCDRLEAKTPRSDVEIWRFDRLDRIGGMPISVEGDPRILPSPWGHAIGFDGIKDAILVPRHPLSGAAHFTAEAIFRPDGGAFAQRWLHLASDHAVSLSGNPKLDTRMLFEIRVEGHEWYLDTFVTGPGYKAALIDAKKRFPIGHWYHVAQCFDGKTYQSFVNGVLQAELDIAFVPQGVGQTSIGRRINRVDYFKGAIHSAQFHPAHVKPNRRDIARQWPGILP